MIQPQTFQYLVVRFARENIQGISSPVGLIYWKDEPRDANLRLPIEGETIPGVTVNQDFTVLKDGFIRRLLASLKTGKLPVGEAEPYTAVWWEFLRKAFIHRFRIEGPRTVEVLQPELDFELQYSALVQPVVAAEREEVRIDSWVNSALGPFKDSFETHQAVKGFLGRPVKVLKSARLGDRVVAFDAVNLTAQHAEREMEAMLHRGWELASFANEERRVQVLMGYYASPEGLNGEAKLVEMGEMILGEPLLNLANTAHVQARVAIALGGTLPGFYTIEE